MKIFRFHKSFNSVVIGLAESGNFIPPEIAQTMTPQAISFSSTARHLIPLCECRQLRDTGMLATNVSPLVVDLKVHSPAVTNDIDILSLYRVTTPDGEPIYQDPDSAITARAHQLRRDIFYLPFFQKLNGELNRVVAKFGSATLMMLNCDTQLTGSKIRIAANGAVGNFPDVVKLADASGIELEFRPAKESFVLSDLVDTGGVELCLVTLADESFLDRGDWSDNKADRVRDVLANLVGALVAAQ